MNEGILIVDVGARRVGVDIVAVVGVERMVALTPLVDAADLIDGVIDVRGEVAPVVCLAARLGLESAPPAASDHLVLTRAVGRLVALRVREALEVAAPPASDEIAVGDEDGVDHLVRTSDGLLLIPDLERTVADLELPELTTAGVDGP